MKKDPVYLNDEGRHKARFPFKESHETLPDNFSLCEKLLLKLYNNRKNDTALLKKIQCRFC